MAEGPPGAGGYWLETEAWADVAPEPLDPAGERAVAIDYSPEYRDATGVLKALMRRGEHSERALWLTQRVIDMNPAHYSAWEFRRRCLEATGHDLREEKALNDALALSESTKNYQLWNHRRFLVAALGEEAERELAFTREVLALEPKHYHAWAHRQWLLKEGGGAGWAGEAAVTAAFLEADVRNNSAWNHRFFCVSEAPGAGGLGAQRGAEFEFAARMLRRDVQNESVWNYLRGLFALDGKGEGGGGDEGVATIVEHRDALEAVCAEALGKDPACPFALSFLAEVKLSAATHASVSGAQSRLEAKRLAQGAMDLWQQLIGADPMRTPYWGLRASEAQSLVLSLDLLDDGD